MGIKEELTQLTGESGMVFNLPNILPGVTAEIKNGIFLFRFSYQLEKINLIKVRAIEDDTKKSGKYDGICMIFPDYANKETEDLFREYGYLRMNKTVSNNL